MSQPPKYTPVFSFTDFASGFPSSQPPGAKIDIELQAIKTTTDRVIDNLALIQRDDGALKNGSVGFDQLTNDAQEVLATKGDLGATGPAGLNAIPFTNLAAVAAATIDPRVHLIWVTGTTAQGDPGAAMPLVEDSSVDAAYVTANPTTSVRDAAGRGFRRAPQPAAAISYSSGTIVTPLDRSENRLNNAPIYVTDAPYNAVGDGTTDDSSAIQAAIDANKGKVIVLPQGKTFLAAGIALSGSSYNGTTILIEGTLKMKARANSSTWNWDVSGSPTYNGIILHDCEFVTVDVPGMIDGNRANQPNSMGNDQQCHCLQLRGVRNFNIPRFNAKEVRGDGIITTTKTNIAPLSTNTSNGTIGLIRVVNSADDGRNALSIVSGENITIAGGCSMNVGGTIGGLRMPGGFDIEPDGNWHKTKNIVSGPWTVTTAGTSGIAVDGKALTDDATRDWIATDIQIAPSVVVITTSAVGGLIIRRCARVGADITVIRTGGRNACVVVDYIDFSKLTFNVSGVSTGVEIGTQNFVNDSHIDARVTDHSGPGLLVIGANRSRFTGQVNGGQGAGSYGVQVAPGTRGTLTQSGNVYSVDVPYDANNSFGFLTSSGMTFSNCVIADCAFLGYSGYSVMFGLNVFLPTRNVQGRNYTSAVPTNGYWAAGDVVMNTSPAAGGTPGWVCTTQGAAGTFVFKAMASVAA